MRAIIQYKKDGKAVARFDTIINASKSTGISRQSINNNLTARSKSAGGYVFLYTIINNC